MFDRSLIDSHCRKFNMRVGENKHSKNKKIWFMIKKKNPKRCSRGLSYRKKSLKGMK
jgi:hypothetical protein